METPCSNVHPLVGCASRGPIPVRHRRRKFESDLQATLVRTVRKSDAKYLGITVMPGPQLAQAIPITQSLKELFPRLKSSGAATSLRCMQMSCCSPVLSTSSFEVRAKCRFSN